MATKYLISGNWSANGSWSTTSSAGPANTTAPTVNDDVIFDAGSGACSIDVGAFCRSFDLTGGGSSNYANTLTHPNFLVNIGTSTAPPGGVALKWPTSGWTYNATNAGARFAFSTTINNNTQTVDFGGQTISRVTFTPSATGGIIQLVNHGFACSGQSPQIGVIRGTLDTNGQTVTATTIQITAANTLVLGASTINITGTGTAWDNQSTTTITAGTSTINLSGAAANFKGGAKTYATVNFTGSGVQGILDSGNTFGTLTRTGTAAKTDGFAVSSLTCTGTFTMNSNSITNRLYLTSQQWGTAATITANAYVGDNVDFSDITAAGSGSPFTGTSLGNGLGNTNVTTTTPVTRYGVVAGNWSSTATWSATSGGSGGASVPLPQDTVILNSSSAAGTYMIDVPIAGASLDCTGFTRTLDSNVNFAFYGDFKLVNGMTAVGVSDRAIFRGRSTHNTDPANKALGGLEICSPGGTYTLQNDWLTGSTSNSLTLTAGTFNANDKNMSFGQVQLSLVAVPAFNTRVYNVGNGNLTLQATGTMWDTTVATGLTVNVTSSSTLIIAGSSAAQKNIIPGSVVMPNVSVNGAGTGLISFGTGTYGVISVNINPKTIRFTSAGTATISDLIAVGTAGNLISITASVPGTAATISKASGVVSGDYLSIQDSAATGGASFYAGANSTNVSGNTGWTFTAPPAGNTKSFFLFM